MSNVTQQKQTVAAVFPDTKDGNKAFNVLEAAATELKSITVDRILFERLDFGETEILDRFYGANAAVVDVTERSYQAAMFYQLGLRESFGMKHNVVTCVDQTAITGMRESVTSSPLSNSAAIGVSYVKAKRQHPVALHAVTGVVTLAMPSLCFKLTPQAEQKFSELQSTVLLRSTEIVTTAANTGDQCSHFCSMF